MLNKLIPLVLPIKDKYPKTFAKLVSFAKRFLGGRLGIYPRLMGNEINAVAEVLKSSQWNMTYGKGLAHEKLEDAFAKYLDVPYAIAVGSGGLAIQMTLRAMGLRPGDEVILQIDTCSATAMAVLNAGATPIFADISPQTYMLDIESIKANAGKNTKAIIATHMWGNPENMAAILELAKERNWIVLEDACLALGAKIDNKLTGSFGDVGVFSFGCLKPIQGGEGGMIVTKDKELARELRSMRHWGDRTIDFGERDVTQLSYNGRMPEIVAAVVLEQLKGYNKHLEILRAAILDFNNFLEQNIPNLEIQLGNGSDIHDSSYTQLVLKIKNQDHISKMDLFDYLKKQGIQVWHGNFELITSLSFFKNHSWKEWILKGDIERINKNYTQKFINAETVYKETGLGLGKMNFLSKGNLNNLKATLLKTLEETK